MTLQAIQSQASSDDKDVTDMTSAGIAALHLDASGNGVGTVAVASAGDFEQRSSSAMAEYSHHPNGGNGIAYLGANERAHAGLPHSVSSPSLTVLNSMQLASGATPASLATSQQNLRSLLPAYRPAPDYETAVRIKYGDNIAQLLINPSPPVQQPPQPQLLPIQQVVNMYKPPPPYPYSKASSTSSPNLAAAQGADALLTLAKTTGSVGQLAQGQEHLALTMRNGEPIYQNIPLRQPGSQPNLNQQPARRKWGLPVRSSARSAVISRVQQQTPSNSGSPSSSPSSKRSLADSSISSSSGGSYLVNAAIGTATANIKDHLVYSFSYYYRFPSIYHFFNSVRKSNRG